MTRDEKVSQLTCSLTPHVHMHACKTRTQHSHACMHTTHDARHTLNLYVHAPFVKDMDCYGY